MVRGAGPSCTLIVYVDDATSGLLAAGFFAAETTEAYMSTTRAHLASHLQQAVVRLRLPPAQLVRVDPVPRRDLPHRRVAAHRLDDHLALEVGPCIFGVPSSFSRPWELT